MKNKVLIGLFLLLLVPSGFTQDDRREQRRQRRRQLDEKSTVYAKADDGTELRWTVYPGAGPGPHPAVLVIHGGGFVKEPNSPKTLQTAEDAAAAGFNAFHVEYRLASRRGGLSGQTSSGQYPDQTNDLKLAVRAARKFPGGNGKVGAIGGSAGGAHAVYLAATGTAGDDRLDAAVALSGAYDFNDLGSQKQRNFQRLVINYAGSSDPAALTKASPVTYVDANTAPLLVMASDDDAMPPEQYDDLIKKLNASGARDFQKLLRTNSRAHAFAYWPEVRQQCLAFLKQKLGAPSTAPSTTP